jgi:hypothetical protein
MNANQPTRRRKSLLLLLLVVPAAIWLGQQVTLAYAKEEGRKMANEINEIKMQTVCVGRFLIDVPSDAQVSFRPAFLAGWSLNSDLEETDTDFVERLSATEQKHKTAKNERDGPSLESVKTIDTGGAFGKIFVYGRAWVYGFENGKRVDSTFVAVDASVRIKGVSFDFAREIGDEADVKRLVQFISQLQPRPDNSIPSDSGFCFDGGLLRDPLTAAQNERVGVFIGLKGHPDVAIAANTMAGLKHERSLLQRDEENTVKQSNLGNFRTLRRGPRAINGVPGEEVLDVIIEPNGTRGQSLMWESLPKQDSVYLPYFVLEMNTGHGQPGNPINSSLSDARALALWERISASLRLRPTSLQSTAVEKSALPIGTLALASEECSQTGWWRCTDGNDEIDIVGGRHQHFSEGQVLPQAVLLTPATLWQSIRGEKPTFTSSIPSRWKLVDRRKAPRNQPFAFLAKALPQAEVSVDEGEGAHQKREVGAGAEVMSALACPASGWWECAETKALDGTRWFARGNLMPPATVPVSVSLAEKIKGAPEFARVKANWRLMRVAEQPAAPDDSEQKPVLGADDTATGPSKDA